MEVIFSSITTPGGSKINKYLYSLNEKTIPYFDRLDFGLDINRIGFFIRAVEFDVKAVKKTRYLKKERALVTSVKIEISELDEMSDREIYLFIAASFFMKLKRLQKQYLSKTNFDFFRFAISLKHFFDTEIFVDGKTKVLIPKELEIRTH